MIRSGKRGLRAYSSAAPAVASTLVLSRNPVITAAPPRFEAQYYRYQNELWKRLMWTFPSWFYYRKGTISEQAFRELNPGPVYNNPNIEFPRGRPEVVHQRDRRFKQEIRLPKTYKAAEAAETAGAEGAAAAEAAAAASDDMSRQVVPNARTTAADAANDRTSLERKLDRTLYLAVRPQGGQWQLPTFGETSEVKALHTMAEEGLHALGGDQINYFNVSRTPCHVYRDGERRQYLIKSHILSGKFVPQHGEEFEWLTKEELGEALEGGFYHDVKHLLSNI
ncbi:Large ribosomal subunit protein mL46 [[Candida] zeylanoides]